MPKNYLLPRYLRIRFILGILLALVIWLVTLAHAATVQLTWDAPVWPAGQTPLPLVSYVLERDNTEVARPLAPPYSDTVEPGTYTYAVRALYSASQVSEPSNTVSVTIAAAPPVSVPTTFGCVLTPGTPPTFVCEAASTTPPGPYPLRPVGTVTVAAFDSQETIGGDGRALNAIDGKSTTYWHTQWQAAQPPLPHLLTLDLGSVMWCDALRYVPRQDGNPNGIITSYRVETSSDLATWTSVGIGAWALTGNEKIVRFPATKTRYVRLVVLVSNGTPYASAAEVGI